MTQVTIITLNVILNFSIFLIYENNLTTPNYFFVYDSKLNCVKISEFTPVKFFNWLKALFQKTLTEEKINESEKLSDIIARSDKGGSRLFTNLKSSPLYDINPTPYRTYNLSGIKQIQEIVFKKSKLLELSGIKVSKPTKEEITTNNP